MEDETFVFVILEYLNCLDQYIKNCDPPELVGAQPPLAFYWKDTPEGHGFWSRINSVYWEEYGRSCYAFQYAF